jgi:cell cycle sensor histidine kinase DivJ
MSRLADITPVPRLLGPILIWLVVVLAGGAVAMYMTGAVEPVGKVAVGLAVPALLSLILLPFLHETWSQVLLLALWTGFAVVATLIGGFFPIAITFLCIPAIAMLFTRERVVEALVLAALALIATMLSLTLVELGESPLSESGVGIFAVLGTAGTLALTVASMIAGSQGAARLESGQLGRWAGGVSGGFYKFATNGALISANDEGMELFGLKEDGKEVRLATLTGLQEADASLVESADLARRYGRQTVTRLALPNGKGVRRYDMTITPTQRGGWLVHAMDRTPEAELMDALRESRQAAKQDVRDKTLFFAGVSHELRTPLNAIIGFSDMMRSRLFGPLPGKYAEYADLIHDSGQYMLDLIGDVLDLSKVEAGQYTLVPDTFDMADVVRSSVKMIRPAADTAEIAVEVDVPEYDPLLVTADRKASRQILLNLMSNAVKFSAKGGQVRVSARENGSGVILTVADDGPGMSEADLARVGAPFAQGEASRDVDARGSGLGLSLVRTLAELHGGTLSLESVPGEGTTAEVRLPSLRLESQS